MRKQLKYIKGKLFAIGMILNARQHNVPIVSQEQEGVLLELIPDGVSLFIVDPGTGRTAIPGNFVTMRQQTYLENGQLVAEGRRTFIRGRRRLIEGLQVGLAYVKEGMRGKFFFSYEYAYGSQSINQIPEKSNIVMNFDIATISEVPRYADNEEEDTILELKYLSKCADNQAIKGNWYDTMILYTKAMHLIFQDRRKEYKQASQKIMMAVHIKAIEVAIIIKDYYQAIFWAYRFFEYPGKTQEIRCLMARGKAYSEVGEFDLADEDFRKVLLLNPNYEPANIEINKLQSKKQKYDRMGYNQVLDVVPLQQEFVQQVPSSFNDELITEVPKLDFPVFGLEGKKFQPIQRSQDKQIKEEENQEQDRVLVEVPEIMPQQIEKKNRSDGQKVEDNENQFEGEFLEDYKHVKDKVIVKKDRDKMQKNPNKVTRVMNLSPLDEEHFVRLLKVENNQSEEPSKIGNNLKENHNLNQGIEASLNTSKEEVELPEVVPSGQINTGNTDVATFKSPRGSLIGEKNFLPQAQSPVSQFKYQTDNSDDNDVEIL